MIRLTGILAGIVCAIAATVAHAFPANLPPVQVPSLLTPTQGIQLQLGISDGMIVGVLTSNGYSDIRITRKKLTKARAEACRAGKRYDVEIGFEGRIRKTKVIGNCGLPINPQVARQILRKNGYDHIFVRPEGNSFAAVACRGGRRFRIVMDVFGKIQNDKLIGHCGGGLSRYDVVALMRAQGLSRIDVKNGRHGNYAVEACREGSRVGLIVGGDGAIIRERQIGRCDPPIHPAMIPSLLAGYGLSRVEVIDRNLPRYLARACRGDTRLELAMNRYGEIMDERNIGRCDPPLTSAGLEQQLLEAGFTGVKILQRRPNGFTAEVCEDAVLLRLNLTVFGETIMQDRIGDCPSRPVGDIIADIERRGFSNIDMFVDGCKRGRRIRIELDRLGGEVRRSVIGRCR